MSRSIFDQRRKRLRNRRIIIVSVAILLVACLVLGLIFLLGGGDKDQSQQAAPSTTVATSRPTIISGGDVIDIPEDEPPTMEPVRELPTDFIDRHTQAPRIILYDISAQTMLYSKNGDDPCAPASLTKLMTAIVALENASTDELLTAGDELYLLDPESSRAGIYIGHKMTLKQALQGLLLKSGNDAAYMIAAQIGHKMDESLTGQAAIDLFCRKMTEKAKELGCTNTTFLNPDGIDKKGHQTTANDLLKISLYALKHPLIAEIVATEKVTTTFASGQTKTWQNSNKLIQSDSKYTYDGTCGLKTGTTDAAGNCLISCATRDGRTVLCILLGAKTDAIRYEESIELLNLGFW